MPSTDNIPWRVGLYPFSDCLLFFVHCSHKTAMHNLTLGIYHSVHKWAYKQTFATASNVDDLVKSNTTIAATL